MTIRKPVSSDSELQSELQTNDVFGIEEVQWQYLKVLISFLLKPPVTDYPSKARFIVHYGIILR